MALRPCTVVIENLTPLAEGGRYPIKRSVGESMVVEADIFKEGHDVVRARLKWRKAGDKDWHCARMEPIPNGDDRWRGHCSFFENTQFELTIEAWGDAFCPGNMSLPRSSEAALPDLTSADS